MWVGELSHQIAGTHYLPNRMLVIIHLLLLVEDEESVLTDVIFVTPGHIVARHILYRIMRLLKCYTYASTFLAFLECFLNVPEVPEP
jgi:hypothetical protein